MRSLAITIFLVLNTSATAQISLGGNATFWLGSNASFFAGSNTTFNGTITNNGEIISFSDLDFVANRNVGSLRFVGTGDQNLSGDTLDVTNLEIDKIGSTVILLTDRVVVSGNLNVTNGVIQAEDELDLLVSGSTDNTGQGFVEGKLVGLTSGRDLTFPMGLNGSTNYLTLSTTNSGTIIRVECQLPDPEILNPEEDVQEISDEVEWVLTTLQGGTAEVTFTVDFSGVDLSGTTYGESIRSRFYEPAILSLQPGDSLFRILETQSTTGRIDTDVVADIPPTSAQVVSSELITLSDQPLRLAIAWVPIAQNTGIFVPNIFAPKGIYEENRVFRPFLAGDVVTSVSMKVINSLSSEVYSFSLAEDDIDLSQIGWDGRLPSGQSAPGGVYYYTITVVSGTGSETRTGTVLLVE
ncbi:MAG: hypothetical protein RIM99_10320 [Cyclobacteriaceae bacterium]